MTIGDIFTLKSSIAPRLIRCLYFVMLIVIAVFVTLGVMRGIRIMSFVPPPMPGRYPRLFGNPPLDGTLLILWSLLRGAIAVMIVRILAEMGLAVLAMPRRTET